MATSNDYNALKKSTLTIPSGNVELTGDLILPDPAHSLVIFAHGSGSSRLSPRNQMVARYLNRHGIATFLFDLLTFEEDKYYANRFNLPLLKERLKSTTTWLTEKESCVGLRTGYFGASTGAAAALMAASELNMVAAVVSRGGRPDLAIDGLPRVKAATLLIVGSLDTEVIALNQQAYNNMNCVKKLEIVPGARHLFEEKGAMEKVCVLASNWFEMYLQPLELMK